MLRWVVRLAFRIVMVPVALAIVGIGGGFLLAWEFAANEVTDDFRRLGRERPWRSRRS